MAEQKNKKKKEEKKKPQYSVLQNLKFTFGNIWKWDKTTIFLSLLRIPVNVLTPLLGIYLSRAVVSVVTHNGSTEELLMNILIFSLGMDDFHAWILSLALFSEIENKRIAVKTKDGRIHIKLCVDIFRFQYRLIVF